MQKWATLALSESLRKRRWRGLLKITHGEGEGRLLLPVGTPWLLPDTPSLLGEEELLLKQGPPEGVILPGLNPALPQAGCVLLTKFPVPQFTYL